MNLKIETPIASLRLFRNNSGRIDGVSFALVDGRFLRVSAKTRIVDARDEIYFLDVATNDVDFTGQAEVFLLEAFSRQPYQLFSISREIESQMILVGLQIAFYQTPPIVIACGSLAHAISIYGFETKAIDREYEYDSLDCELNLIGKFEPC